jgi:hypothetical protein
VEIKQLIRDQPLLTVGLTGLIFGVMLHYSLLYNWQILLDVFLTTVLAFLTSDAISKYIIRGSKGAVQIPATGTTQIQPESYNFLVLFISIPISGVFVDYLSRFVTLVVAANFSGLLESLVIGLVLSGLVYLDLQAKYYSR